MEPDRHLRFFLAGRANPGNAEGGADAAEVADTDSEVEFGQNGLLEVLTGGMRLSVAGGNDPGGEGIAELRRMTMTAIDEGAGSFAPGPQGEPIGRGATHENSGGMGGLVPPTPSIHCGDEAGFRVLTSGPSPLLPPEGQHRSALPHH